jgi:hypothetical protein
MKKFSILALLIALLTACGSDGPAAPAAPEPINVSGQWSGPMGGGVTLLLTLSQAGSSVSGSGNMSGPGGAIAMSASGTYVEPNLSLTLSAQGYEDMNFTGKTVTRTSISGTLNGSGFVNQPITFTKQ